MNENVIDKETWRPCYGCDVMVTSETTLCREDKEFLSSQGISLDVIPYTMSSVEAVWMNKVYRGIAIKNRLNGLELFSTRLPITRPITVGHRALLYYPQAKGHHTKACNLFSDFLDYYAFLTLQQKKWGGIHLCHYDCMVMGDLWTFMSLIEESRCYEFVNCYFPNDDFGKTMERTALWRLKKKVFSQRYLYEKYTDLRDLLKHL